MLHQLILVDLVICFLKVNEANVQCLSCLAGDVNQETNQQDGFVASSSFGCSRLLLQRCVPELQTHRENGVVQLSKSIQDGYASVIAWLQSFSLLEDVEDLGLCQTIRAGGVEDGIEEECDGDQPVIIQEFQKARGYSI